MKDLRDPLNKFVRLPLPKYGERRATSRRMRLIGEPHEFVQYDSKVKVPNTHGLYRHQPFPDADKNKAFLRRGRIDDENCVWQSLGYRPAYSAASIVIEEDDNGIFWLPKIIVKGVSFWRQIQEIEENSKVHNHNVVFNAPDAPSFYVTSQSKLESPLCEYRVTLSDNIMLTDENITEFISMYHLPTIFAPHTL